MIFQITILCVTGALLSLTIRRNVPDVALLLTIAVTILAVVRLLEPLNDTFRFFEELAASGGVSQAIFVPLYKVIGIGVIVRIGSSFCRDAKESALAVVIETTGSVCALLAALPLIEAIFTLMMELVQ